MEMQRLQQEAGLKSLQNRVLMRDFETQEKVRNIWPTISPTKEETSKEVQYGPSPDAQQIPGVGLASIKDVTKTVPRSSMDMEEEFGLKALQAGDVKTGTTVLTNVRQQRIAERQESRLSTYMDAQHILAVDRLVDNGSIDMAEKVWNKELAGKYGKFERGSQPITMGEIQGTPVKIGGRVVGMMVPSGKIGAATFHPVSDENKAPGDVTSFETAYNVDPKLRGTPQYIKAFEHFKTQGQEAYGAQRIMALLQQPMSVYDTNTGNFELLTKEQITQANAANQKAGLGSRFVGEGAARFAKPKLATFNEIETSSQQVREALKKIEFTEKQIAKFSQVLKTVDDGSSIRNFLATNVAKTLTTDEINYVTAVKNLKESAFALRSISGMGQGSDLLRSAIEAVVPGTRTPNKEYAVSSLARFDTQIQKLREGIPGLGKEGSTKGQVQPPKEQTVKAGPKTGDIVDGYKFKGGDPAKQESWEKVKK
jgi:hypothetical protein